MCNFFIGPSGKKDVKIKFETSILSEIILLIHTRTSLGRGGGGRWDKGRLKQREVVQMEVRNVGVKLKKTRGLETALRRQLNRGHP